MSDLAREIKEELREEKILNFLKENTRYFVIFAVCLVLFSSIMLWYKSFSRNKVYQDGAEYITAVTKIQSGNLEDGLKKFENLKDNSSNYAAMANLNVAAYHIYNKHYAKASIILEEVEQNTSYDSLLREFAGFYKIVVNLDAGGDRATAISALNKYIKQHTAYELNARELLLVLYINEKNPDLAKEQVALIKSDKAAPQTLIARVTQYMSLIEN